jgi:hypothetical protein
MRTISDDSASEKLTSKATPVKKQLETYTTKLSDGRVITIREMTGRDLIFMEKDLSKDGDIEKGMKLIGRLIVGDDKITYEEILDLGVRDFRKLSELVAKANGDEEDSPN